ncbi:MAG: ribose 5-phosphate isomerase B [Salibacteraceae bacterium]
MIIAIACDHAGYELKDKVKAILKSKNYSVKDFGTNGPDSVDYPDFVHPLANAVEEGEVNLGIVICGSGNGVNITVNKHQGVRSALCWNPELAKMARLHNDANVLALSSRYVDEKINLESIEAFLSSEFEGGRHQNRVNKIACS